MQRGLRGVLLVGATACIGLLSTTAQGGSHPFSQYAQSAHDSPSAESIVRFAPGTSAADMTRIVSDAGGDVATVMPEISAVAVRSDSSTFESNVEASPKVEGLFVDRYISWAPSDERLPIGGRGTCAIDPESKIVFLPGSAARRPRAER